MKANNLKKKNINKIKDSEITLVNDENKSSNDNSTSMSSQIIEEEISTKKSIRRQVKSIINITMNKDEEMVYSSMGLDPILLLEEPPNSENYMVHIIRPGEEEERSKDHENTILLQEKEPIEKGSADSVEVENIKENEEEANLDLEKESNQLMSSDQILITEENELNPNDTKEADEDPRRKRRRSSASS